MTSSHRSHRNERPKQSPTRPVQTLITMGVMRAGASAAERILPPDQQSKQSRQTKHRSSPLPPSPQRLGTEPQIAQISRTRSSYGVLTRNFLISQPQQVRRNPMLRRTREEVILDDLREEAVQRGRKGK